MLDTASETQALPFEEAASSSTIHNLSNSRLLAFIRGLVSSSNGPLGQSSLPKRMRFFILFHFDVQCWMFDVRCSTTSSPSPSPITFNS
jgi:hypothetical protein